MSLLFKILFASAARSTHHKIALDALRHLRLPDAQQWMDVFLRYHVAYLEGAKAPDNDFKDFKNHVLHVHDGYWGGAIAAAQKWYEKTLVAMKSHDWDDAAYSAGVLSHYFTDPLMPLHTGQSEDEGPVHRAVEWSVCKSYGELQHILDEDQGGYPRWECPTGDDWLALMIRKAADLANPYYDTVIDHYNLEAGVRDPLLGLDQTLKDVFAKCLGYSVVGFARILEKLIEDSKAFPPFVEVTLQGVLAVAKLPFRAVARHTENVRELEMLRQVYDEFERTGKVIDSLSPDDAAVRKAHAEEVLKVPLSQLDDQPIRKPGQRHGQGADQRERSHCSVLAPVIDNRRRNAAIPQPEPAKAEPKLQRPELLPVKREVAKAGPPVEIKEKKETKAAQERILRPHDVATEVEEPAAPAVPQPKEKKALVATTPPSNPPPDEPVKDKAKEKPAATEPKLKFHLDRSRPIQDAPSIGSKTAERMKSAGIKTVGELLAAHPDKLAAKLDVAHIVPDVIRQWQAEATMCCRVAGLRGHDAQILVACGIDQPAELAEIEADELLELIQPFVESPDGQRVLRGSAPPDEDEVTAWIAAAQQARSLKAA